MHLLPVLAGLVGYVPFETATGIPLHWPRDVVTPILVGHSLADAPPEADVLRITAAALAKWLDIACDQDGPILDHRPRFDDPLLTNTVLSEDDHNVSLVWITDPTDWSNRGFGSTELARTAVIHKVQSGEIVDGDVAFNEAGFTFGATAECPTVYDFESTITHELGHVMGLDHSAVTTATMAAKTDAGACDKRDLDPDDEAGFCATYTEPRPPEPDPGPEPEPRPEVVETAPPSHPKDDGCNAGTSTTWVVLVLAGLLRRARRASAPSRR